MKYRTQWNLGLLYKSDTDSQIEKDMAKIETACIQFEKKYKNKNFSKTSGELYKALKDYETLLINTVGGPVWYFHLYKDIESDNSNISAKEMVMGQRRKKAINKILFFTLELGKISKERQSVYLKDSKLKYYRYFLEKIFNRAKFNLTEKEEQLFSLVSQPASGMWFDAQKKLLNAQTVIFNNKKISLSEATELLPTLNKKQRDALYKEIVQSRKATAHLAEAEINAIYNFQKISDELRGFPKPYSETVMQYENDEAEVEDLALTITKYFRVSKRFYALHAKLLKQKKIGIADINSPIGTISRKFDFDSAVNIVRRSFAKFDQKYSDLLDTYLKNGQIDVYPRVGKISGGYCSNRGKFPVFILLNHTDKLSSVETLAHEMGHAIHSELTKPLFPMYDDYSTSVAEVASTFFEQFASEDVIEILPDKEKIIILHEKLKNDMVTIFRQIACFNCENELHKEIRAQGQLSSEKMAEIMQKHLKSYLGNAVEVKKDDGYIFTTWAHLRYSFYVYTYAYGQIISKVLYREWKKDTLFKTQIEKFLSAGNTKSPKDIFKSIGIKTDASFFESGLKSIEQDLMDLERLVKRKKLI